MYWVHFWRLRSDRNSIPTWPRHSITLSFDIGVLYCAQLHGSCHTGSGAGCSPVHIKTAKIDDDFQFYPCFNGLPSENLEDYTFEVEALAAGSKDDEKKLIGPRLVRRLGGVPGAFARRELHMPDLAKPDGYKLILLFLEKKKTRKMLWTGDFLRIAGMRLLHDVLDRPCKTSLQQITWQTQTL